MRGAREPEATYRRRRLVGVVAVLVLLTLLVNGGQWLQHRRLRQRLDVELGAHLVATAEVIAVGIDGDMLQRWRDWGVDEDEADRLLDYLSGARAAGSLSNLFLLDPDDPEGHSVLDLSGVVPTGAANPIVALDRAALTLAAAGIPATTGLQAAPGGAYLKAGYAPITADDGEVTGILGVEGSSALFSVLDDVRKTLVVVAGASLAGVALLGFLLVRISESLARAERGLARAEALTAMGRMAAGIAHEIRNPLGIIRATAERLKRRHAPAEAADPLFDSIPEEVDRLNGILTGYLNFAADRPSEHALVDLVPLVRRTCELGSGETGGSGIEVESTIEVAEAPVLGDRGRLRQMLLNLVLNAHQAMPDGGRLTLELNASGGRGRGYRIAVSDTGEGIPRARLREIWKPFFTSRPEGSGLGLTIVRRIVLDHQGEVSIDSEEGRGTTVTVVLPAADSPGPVESISQPGGEEGERK